MDTVLTTMLLGFTAFAFLLYAADLRASAKAAASAFMAARAQRTQRATDQAKGAEAPSVAVELIEAGPINPPRPRRVSIDEDVVQDGASVYIQATFRGMSARARLAGAKAVPHVDPPKASSPKLSA